MAELQQYMYYAEQATGLPGWGVLLVAALALVIVVLAVCLGRARQRIRATQGAVVIPKAPTSDTATADAPTASADSDPDAAEPADGEPIADSAPEDSPEVVPADEEAAPDGDADRSVAEADAAPVADDAGGADSGMPERANVDAGRFDAGDSTVSPDVVGGGMVISGEQTSMAPAAADTVEAAVPLSESAVAEDPAISTEAAEPQAEDPETPGAGNPEASALMAEVLESASESDDAARGLADEEIVKATGGSHSRIGQSAFGIDFGFLEEYEAEYDHALEEFRRLRGKLGD